MAMFNSYVSLPKGNYLAACFTPSPHQTLKHWLRDYPSQVAGRWGSPKNLCKASGTDSSYAECSTTMDIQSYWHWSCTSIQHPRRINHMHIIHAFICVCICICIGTHTYTDTYAPTSKCMCVRLWSIICMHLCKPTWVRVHFLWFQVAAGTQIHPPHSWEDW